MKSIPVGRGCSVITVAFIAAVLIIVFGLEGCASTLRCGTDGESSYVELDSLDDVERMVGAYTELCRFGYVKRED